MAWSTREVADLAGTTVNTVRHYHHEGLLELPDRMSNGYKQYQVRHLVRLLQIRRLRELGVPLDRIEQVGATSENSTEALEAIDADLASSIERLQRARAEIRAILAGSSVTDVPAGFENVAARLSTPERSLALIYSQLYDDEAMADLRDMFDEERSGEDAEFDALATDADEATRQRLAEALAPAIAKNLADYPWLFDPSAHLSKGARTTEDTFRQTMVALYNPAQLDVLVRASRIATGHPEDPA